MHTINKNVVRNEEVLFCKLAQEFFSGKKLSYLRCLRTGSRGSVWVGRKQQKDHRLILHKKLGRKKEMRKKSRRDG